MTSKRTLTLKVKRSFELPSIELLYPAFVKVFTDRGWTVKEVKDEILEFSHPQSKWGSYYIPKVSKFSDEIPRIVELIEAFSEVSNLQADQSYLLVLNELRKNLLSTCVADDTPQCFEACSNDPCS